MHLHPSPLLFNAMGRSRIGGTRALVSGIVGSVVFSVGKNSDGGWEQYIATYNDQKENPNTKYQALARMQIALIERMVYYLSYVLRASFEGVAVGANSVNEFAKVNMKSIQDYWEKYWYGAYGWAFPQKGNPEYAWAPLIVSQGSMATPKKWSVEVGSWPRYVRHYIIQLPATAQNKVVDIRKALGISRKGSFNIVQVIGQYNALKTGACFIKGQISQNANDAVVITPNNIGQILNIQTKILAVANTQEMVLNYNLSYDKDTHRIELEVLPMTYTGTQWITWDTFLHATIFSDYKKNKWIKSTSRLTPPQSYTTQDEYGRAPYEAYQTWDANYHDETYKDYFGRK